jgi:REP element-mobilizing transposase RayT
MRHVILFTLHTYGSWLPDRLQGYFHHQRGLLPQSSELATTYRNRQVSDSFRMYATTQRAVLEEMQAAADHQRWTLYAAATDLDHLHTLTAWDDDRSPAQIRANLKRSLTLRLSRDKGRRCFFTKRGHDRRVRDASHFLHLREQYLPDHRGWCWDRRTGWRPPREDIAPTPAR